jgi:hypothetical protein
LTIQFLFPISLPVILNFYAIRLYDLILASYLRLDIPIGTFSWAFPSLYLGLNIDFFLMKGTTCETGVDDRILLTFRNLASYIWDGHKITL